MTAEPLVDEGGLAGAAGGDDLNEIGVGVGPGAVEESELVFAANQRGVGDGELGGEGARGGGQGPGAGAMASSSSCRRCASSWPTKST